MVKEKKNKTKEKEKEMMKEKKTRFEFLAGRRGRTRTRWQQQTERVIICIVPKQNFINRYKKKCILHEIGKAFLVTIHPTSWGESHSTSSSLFSIPICFSFMNGPFVFILFRPDDLFVVVTCMVDSCGSAVLSSPVRCFDG